EKVRLNDTPAFGYAVEAQPAYAAARGSDRHVGTTGHADRSSRECHEPVAELAVRPDAPAECDAGVIQGAREEVARGEPLRWMWLPRMPAVRRTCATRAGGEADGRDSETRTHSGRVTTHTGSEL